MDDWGRDTPWRQGSVLPAVVVTDLGLCDAGPVGDSVALVISHDCDLANSQDQEPHVEVIVGRCIAQVEGNFTHAKNPRKLHLEFQQNGGVLAGEFLATAKKLVPKNKLVDQRPRDDLKLTPQNHEILQRWLAVRYRRAAFPEEFERRLRDTKLGERLARIVAPSGSFFRAVMFNVDNGEETIRCGEDDLYQLDIILLYATDQDPERAFEAASQAKATIETTFREKLYTNDLVWKWMELRDCDVMSDEAMTVKQSGVYKHWRLEHMSLREEPAGPTLDE